MGADTCTKPRGTSVIQRRWTGGFAVGFASSIYCTGSRQLSQIGWANGEGRRVELVADPVFEHILQVTCPEDKPCVVAMR